MAMRVFIADRSARARKVFSDRIAATPRLEVVGTASSLDVVASRLERLSPDVLVLDLGMVADRGDMVRKLIMSQSTVAVTDPASKPRWLDDKIRAMFAGIQPREPSQAPEAVVDELCQLVRGAYRSGPMGGGDATVRLTATPVMLPRERRRRPELIALGSSTGGATALGRILPMFPADSPPIVVVDHMPEGYTRDFAARLDSTCTMTVVEATDNGVLEPGIVAIAPGGDRHLQVVRRAGRLRTILVPSPPTDGHVPSVTELFASVARVVGANAAAALLTGMGRDGASGLMGIREAGGLTVSQDAATSVVYGMPKVAHEMGASMEQLPLGEIPARLVRGR